MTVGGLWEVLFAMVRGHEVNEGFLVTGMLFPLTLPPTIPLWQVAIGISFGVVIGKEIFGGTGKNFLNPALTARTFLYFAYASEISAETNRWGQGVWAAADGITGATPLGAMAAAKGDPSSASVPEVAGLSWWDCFFGWTQGSMGETSTLCALIGAAVLIAVGVGSWRIMVGCVIGLLAMGQLALDVQLGQRQSYDVLAATLALGDWRFRLRRGFHGDRSGLCGDDRHGSLDLRNFNRG